MNEIEDRLNRAVRAEAGFTADAVGARVARRRSRRRVATGVGAVLLVAAVGVGVAQLAGDDEPELNTVTDGEDDGGGDDGGGGEPVVIDDDTPTDVVIENPVGADGATGATSTAHLTAESPFPECESLGRDGPATGDEYAAQVEQWERFSADFVSSDWPFVSGFGSPENIWGRPSILLTRPDAETYARLLDYYDPDTACVELPPVEDVPPVPFDVPWTFVDEPAVGDTSVRVVEVSDCAVKAQHFHTFVVEFDDRVEVGIQAWSELGGGFQDDCPLPTEYEIDLPSPVDDRPIVVAAARPLRFDGHSGPGNEIGFTISPGNLAGFETMGDDLIARLVDDPSVRFQVSDVFSSPRVTGMPRAVALDQWPATGAGTIAIPPGVPAGTYTVQFLDQPQLNGLLILRGELAPQGETNDDEPETAFPNGGFAEGELSDIHVEAFEIPLPECTEEDLFADAPDERRAELADLRTALQAQGLHDQPFISTTSAGDVIEIGMNRRYGPTIEWTAERVSPDDVCLLFYPPPGVFTAPPEEIGWIVLDSDPGSSELTLQIEANCGLVMNEMLAPAVVESDSEVLITWVPETYFGPSFLPCRPPDETTVLLTEPLGDRVVRPAAVPAAFDVAAGDIVAVPVGRLATATVTGLGDDVMIQSVDDPSLQIQVTGVWSDPTSGPPELLQTDRYAPADTATLHVPAGTPPGDYTWVFIEHQQLNGRLTVTG